MCYSIDLRITNRVIQLDNAKSGSLYDAPVHNDVAVKLLSNKQGRRGKQGNAKAAKTEEEQVTYACELFAPASLVGPPTGCGRC